MPRRAQLAFDSISFGAYGIQPKPQAVPRLSNIFRVGFDEGVLVVGDPPISGVQDDTGSVA